MSQWFETWFDSKYYPILYQQRDDEEAAVFIEKLVQFLHPEKEALFLDLACGTGRHCRQICRLGYEIHGADYSLNNIENCKASSPQHLYFYRHDMRQPLPHKYDVILNLFTSFGYFASHDEHVKTLNHIYNGLHKQGIFVLDFLNIKYIERCMVSEETLEVNGVSFEISRQISNHCIRKQILIQENGHSEVFDEEVTAYTKSELEGMLKDANFEILNIFGDYILRPFAEGESDRLIFVAKKC